MSAAEDPTFEEDIPDNACEPVDDSPPVVDRSCAPKPKRKPGRPPGSLNKKTIAKQSALAAGPPAKQAQDTGVQSKAVRPKKKRQPSSSDSGSSATPEQLVDRSSVVVVKRRKKRVVVMEESDSSPSPIVVKRKRSSVPRPSSPAAPEPNVVPMEQLGKTLRDAQLERMIAQHQRYNGYFAHLK